MKSISFIFVLLISGSLFFHSFSQQVNLGPLANDSLINLSSDTLKDYSNELVMMGPRSSRIFKYMYHYGGGDTLMRSESLPYNNAFFDFKPADAVSGNFIGLTDQVVTAYTRDDFSLILSLYHINATPDGSTLDTLSTLRTAPGFLGDMTNQQWMNGTNEYCLVRMQAGNFDNDSLDELVVASILADSSIRLSIFDFDTAFSFVPVGTIADEKAYSPYYSWDDCEGDQHIIFDITTQDPDNDGIDEIMLTASERVDSSAWDIFVKIYDYNTSSHSLVPKTKAIAFEPSDNPAEYIVPFLTRLFIKAGSFSAVNANECIMSFYTCDTARFRHDYIYPNDFIYYLRAIQISSDLSDITFGEKEQKYHHALSWWDYSEEFNMTSGDLNADGLDEIMVASLDSIELFEVDPQLKLQSLYAIRDRNGAYGSRTITFANIDYEKDAESLLPEVNISSYWGDSLVVYNTVWDENNRFKKLDIKKRSLAGGNDDYFSDGAILVSGHFSPKPITLGIPKLYHKTSVDQPLVILNAPPIHFEVFNDTLFDINKCYGENESRFASVYEKSNMNVTELETTVNSDWASTYSAGFDFMYKFFSMGFHLSTTYGEHFSKSESVAHSVKVSQTVTANDDDRIFATVTDYNLWEYPIYAGTIMVGNVLVVEPVKVGYAWFPSKSWSGNSYVPNHEVGNVLSYYQNALHENPDIGAMIKIGTRESPGWVLAEGTYDWSLNFEDFTQSGVETSRRNSMNINFSTSIGGGYNEDYSEGNVSTHKTSLSNGLSIKSHLDVLDLEIGEVSYRVTPYAYWSKRGALVIDYEVVPELSEPGFTETWWQKRYGNDPDLCFYLPWKFDPEKGYTLEDEAKREQTKDITFFPLNPKAGDTVTIKARVHNMSLLSTDSPASVRFFIGDPDNEGTLITGVNGETEVFTTMYINQRSTTQVEMQWVVPEGIPQFPRIYAVIDQDNVIPEIRKTNNKAWTVLGKTDFSTSIIFPEKDGNNSNILNQNYPNPASQYSYISFNLTTYCHVKLEVYNYTGQLVRTILDEDREKGYNEVFVNVQDLPGGIYLYRIQTGTISETKKMTIIR